MSRTIKFAKAGGRSPEFIETKLKARGQTEIHPNKMGGLTCVP